MSSEEMKPEQPPQPEERRAARRQEEKEEKDEKEREKSEKEEKFTRDPLSGLTWALIFIVAGLVLLTESMGFVDWERFGGAWQPILIAAGLIVLLEAALRLIIPAYRRPIIGSLIFAFFLLAIGLGGAFGWNITWPIFLIVLGLAILIGGLFRGRL